jgi:hypothetical protein
MLVSGSASVTVDELLPVLQQRQARLLAGERGLVRPVSWATAMRAKFPAFAAFQGGELALLSLATLRALRSHLVAISLPAVVDQLADTGVVAIAVAGIEGARLSAEDAQAVEEAKLRADAREIPLFALPAGTPLDKLENELINQIVARRERPSTPRAATDPLTAQFRASLRAEALDALLSGTYAGEPQMSARAAQLGHDLSQPYATLWVELDTRAMAGPPAPPLEEPTPLAAELAESLAFGLGAWARGRGTQVVALVPLGRLDRGVAGLAEGVWTMLERMTGGAAAGAGANDTDPAQRAGGSGTGASGAADWMAGVGEPATLPANVRRSAAEAHDAAWLGLSVLGPRHVARIVDLGVYQLLVALREGGELKSFVGRTLAPFDADPRKREQYIETLETLFACCGNVTRAAEELSLHRNSLIHRLNIIKGLLGHNLDDPDLLLTLQLALKGRRVLETR